MDFHGLARRELQALCKRNKIPANITNVAMADALSALPNVEGIEEMMLLQSPEKVGIKSSKTGLTSTRGRKTVTKEPESSQPVSRSRLGTRRIITEDPEVDESKKENLQTPAVRNRAPVAVSSRRKKAEESSVQRVYSTRRSVRLAEQMAGLSLDEGVEKTEAGKMECDLSEGNIVNFDKESDIGSEKKDVTEEALNEKVDMQGVADITPAGDYENEPDVIPNVEVKHECKVEECYDEAKVETKQDVGCEVNQVKVACEVEEFNEEAKAKTKQDVGCEDLLEVDVFIKEDTEEEIVVSGESEKSKESDSSPVTTVFSDAVISDSNHSDFLLESVASSSPTEFMADNLSSAKLESELSTKKESVQVLQDFDAIEPEFAIEEDKSIDVAAAGENSFQKPSGSVDELEITNEESEPAVEGFHAMELESVTDEEKSTGIEDAENSSRNQMASLDQQESDEESDSNGSVIASDGDDSDDTTEDDSSSAEESDDGSCERTEVDPSKAEACDNKITALEIEADASSLAIIKEKAAAATPIKQQTMASETEEKHAREADVGSSVIAEEESIVTEEEKMELKSSNDKKNVAAAVSEEEKKTKVMEVKEQKNMMMPYGDLSLRQLTKMLKTFHIENNGKKNDDHRQKIKKTRTALQVLPENHQMTETEKENWES